MSDVRDEVVQRRMYNTQCRCKHACLHMFLSYVTYCLGAWSGVQEI